MKYLSLFAFLLLFGIACDTEPDIDDRIEMEFAEEFPEAQDVEWTIRENVEEMERELEEAGEEVENAFEYQEYDVRFTNDGEPMMVSYDYEGTKIRENGKDLTVRTTRTIEPVTFRTDLDFVESDVDLSMVGNTVLNAIRRDYAGWEVHKIKQVDQDGNVYYKAELKDPTGKEVKPMYTASGRLVEIDD